MEPNMQLKRQNGHYMDQKNKDLIQKIKECIKDHYQGNQKKHQLKMSEYEGENCKFIKF